MPGTAAGTVRRKQRTVASATCCGLACVRVLLAGDHHVGLEQDRLERNAVARELGEHRAQRALGCGEAGLDRVAAVHQDLGLDDRHQILLDGDGGVARQRVGVGVDREIGRDALVLDVDVDHGAPLGEARAELAVFGAALAQPVEAFGDLLVGRSGERLGAGVDLDARQDAVAIEDLSEGAAVARLLPQRLVVEDDAAQVLLDAGRGEQQVTVGAPILFGGLQRDRVEALLDGPARFVGGEDALAGRHQLPGDRFQLGVVRGHVAAPR